MTQEEILNPGVGCPGGESKVLIGIVKCVLRAELLKE